MRRREQAAEQHWCGRTYLGGKLDQMVAWFVARSHHPPMIGFGRPNDLLNARLIEWRDGGPDWDEVLIDPADWTFDREDISATYYYVMAECGAGKTKWLLFFIAAKPQRVVVAMNRISNIREAERRLREECPHIDRTHDIYTICCEKEHDFRDAEDATDDEHAAHGRTVTFVVADSPAGSAAGGKRHSRIRRSR